MKSLLIISLLLLSATSCTNPFSKGEVSGTDTTVTVMEMDTSEFFMGNDSTVFVMDDMSSDTLEVSL